MGEFFAVAAGGAIGASLRHGATLLFGSSATGSVPWHTFGVNAIGSFLLGLLMALLGPDGAAERWRLFAGVGVLGGFTTFSTFSYETISLLHQGFAARGLGYALGSVAVSLAAAAAGYALGRAL